MLNHRQPSSHWPFRPTTGNRRSTSLGTDTNDTTIPDLTTATDSATMTQPNQTDPANPSTIDRPQPNQAPAAEHDHPNPTDRQTFRQQRIPFRRRFSRQLNPRRRKSRINWHEGHTEVRHTRGTDCGGDVAGFRPLTCLRVVEWLHEVRDHNLYFFITLLGLGLGIGRRIFLMLLVILGWKVEAVMSLWCLGLPSPSRIIPRLPLLAPGCIFHAFIPATCSLLLKCRHWFRRHGLTAFAMRTLEQSKQTGKAAIGIKPDTSKNFPMMPCNLKAQQREHAPSPPSPPWHESSRIPKSSTTGDLLPTRAMSKVSAPSQNNCLPRHFPRDSHNPFLFPKCSAC